MAWNVLLFSWGVLYTCCLTATVHGFRSLHTARFASSCPSYIITPFNMAKNSGGMPSADDLADLDKMLSGEMDWEQDMENWDLPDDVFGDNKPKPKGQGQKGKGKDGSSSSSTHWSPPASTKKKHSNLPDTKLLSQEQRSAVTKPQQVNSVDQMMSSDSNDFSFDDIDYGDFESAMREMEQGGLNPGGGGSKRSREVREHAGLLSGAVLPSEMWTCLVDPQGLKNNQGFSRIHKDQVDLVVLYADPRRSTDEFRVVSSEFNKLPLKTLGAVCTVVNVDDSNDHRKLLKKLTGLPQYSLFSDPTKGVMDLLRCRGAKRVTSCMALLAIPKSGETADTLLSGTGTGIEGGNTGGKSSTGYAVPLTGGVNVIVNVDRDRQSQSSSGSSGSTTTRGALSQANNKALEAFKAAEATKALQKQKEKEVEEKEEEKEKENFPPVFTFTGQAAPKGKPNTDWRNAKAHVNSSAAALHSSPSVSNGNSNSNANGNGSSSSSSREGGVMLTQKDCIVVKVWYQNDWDPFTTKDVVEEEIRQYRRSPAAYLQAQIGLS